MDAADSHDGRVNRVVLTGNNRLELCEDIRADGDGVDAVFRMGAVAAFSADFDGEDVAGSVGRAFFEADGAGVIFRRYVKADENVGLYHVQGAFLYHIFGAGAVLLGRLEQENHISCQFVLDFGQHSGAV